MNYVFKILTSLRNCNVASSPALRLGGASEQLSSLCFQNSARGLSTHGDNGIKERTGKLLDTFWSRTNRHTQAPNWSEFDPDRVPFLLPSRNLRGRTNMAGHFCRAAKSEPVVGLGCRLRKTWQWLRAPARCRVGIDPCWTSAIKMLLHWSFSTDSQISSFQLPFFVSFCLVLGLP